MSLQLSTRQRPRFVFFAWLILIALLGLSALYTEYRADLSVFLPQHPNREEKILAQQLQNGAANRILLLAIEGGSSEGMAKIGINLAQKLRTNPAIAYVHNGQYTNLEKENKLLFEYRYLLSERTQAELFSENGLRTAIQSSIADLAGTAGLMSKDIFAADPTGHMMQLLEKMLPQGGGPVSLHGQWFSPDHRRAMFLVQLALEGTNSNAQEAILLSIQSEFNALLNADPSANSMKLIISGAPVFAIDARNRISSEVSRLSSISLVLIVLLLFWMLKSVRYVLLSLLPLITGVLAGILAVSFWFGSIHGMTIGFGTTLMGEAVDYAIYLFMLHEREKNSTVSTGAMSLWQTIRLGLLTSICGFAALLFSGFNGMAQLGLFSVAGLVVAAAVARWILPSLLPAHVKLRELGGAAKAFQNLASKSTKLRKGLIVLGVMSMAVLIWRAPLLWNHNLGALSPVSAQMQKLDEQLREQIGAGDVRHMLVLIAPDEERVLQLCEEFRPHLQGLINAHLIASYDAPCNIIPSKAMQLRRQAILPNASILKMELDRSLSDMPLKANYLNQFLVDVEVARHLRTLEPKDLKGTALSTSVDAAISKNPDNVTLLIQLRPPSEEAGDRSIDRRAVEMKLKAYLDENAVLLDVKEASENLYKTYMQKTLWFSALGFLGILILQIISLRSFGKVVRVILPLIFAMSAVALGLHACGIALNLLHIVGLLLIFAVGSNYALFFVTTDYRQASPEHQQQTLIALGFANLTTVIGFGILIFSSTPVLQTLGETVGPGALLALVFSIILSRSESIEPSIT